MKSWRESATLRPMPAEGCTGACVGGEEEDEDEEDRVDEREERRERVRADLRESRRSDLEEEGIVMERCGWEFVRGMRFRGECGCWEL